MKLYLFFLFLLVLASILPSCSSQKQISLDKNQLIGTWQQMQFSNDNVVHKPVASPTQWQITGDGKIITSGYTANNHNEYTYQLSGNILKVKTNFGYLTVRVMDFKKKEMTTLIRQNQNFVYNEYYKWVKL